MEMEISFGFYINVLNFSLNAGCNEQKGYRKYLTLMGTVYINKKCRFNSYAMQQIKVVMSYLIKECYLRLVI